MKKLFVALLVSAGLAGSLPASAADILCQTPANNHMLIDDSIVSACIDAGLGNIGQGNQNNDAFIQAGNSGYTTIGQSMNFTQTGLTGTFTIDSSLWDAWGQLFIAFKFGTGGNPDEWFVYQLQDDVSTGDWEFVKMFQQGGGLSHLAIYAKEPQTFVPEPGSIGLLGLGLTALGLYFRRRRA